MLKLSSLHTFLSRVLDPPDLHTAILLTPAGELISYASDPSRSKEDVRIAVGISGDHFTQVEEHGFAELDSTKVGQIYVLPVEDEKDTPVEGWQPLMLIALNFTKDIDEQVVHLKAKALAAHLSKSLSRYREYLILPPRPSPSNISSPTPVR
ncbi:hypothetical protein BT96DRAFT_872628 [Gymnopus androsaceus JB14]|uniref:Roadblock/LAMTOR2 domain-containing protein n=1 Tax=Gymnopus androsaceus JB14 TaxID=1447944 RepID=A0A6A4IHR1_9AGAR|nr:hypothetical protein BT96DRAFT_872628 [Gymnopus androsaceus JB14]